MDWVFRHFSSHLCLQLIIILQQWTGREPSTTLPGNPCSSALSFSKICKVCKGILFGLWDHCSVHHSHSHCRWHSHGHPHPHHALVGHHPHHALVGHHPHSSPRVHHGIYRWSDCSSSKVHHGKSLGEGVGRCLVT